MSGNYILEGESFFVLNKLNSLIDNKKTEINPDCVDNSISFFEKSEYYIYFDPNKEVISNIKNNFIICFMDSNIDQRLDYIKKIKTLGKLITFEPIPTTDFNSLQKIFPNLANEHILPTKKNSLKYKGQKQNYEWFDLCLINDLYSLNDESIYSLMFNSYFDIWKFTDYLWSANPKCILQSQYINDKNFEDYFNRIRETTKDYLEVIQTKATTFHKHKSLLPNTLITNEYRFNKILEKTKYLKEFNEINALFQIEQCLKNVRLGSNPKLEIIKLFFSFKNYVIK
jgi:hypothetical protein